MLNISRFPAQFPGRCLCGVSFAAGARIYWDRSIRRATLCPACVSPKLVAGEAHLLPNGLSIVLHRHPETGLVAAVVIRETCGGWDSWESYRIHDGKWSLAQQGREGALTRAAAHETIEAWIEATGEGLFSTPAALAA